MNILSDYSVIFAVIGAIIALAIVIYVIAKRYKIPNANEALLVLGSKGRGAESAEVKVVIGGSGGAFIIPFVQRPAFIGLDTKKITMVVPEGVSKDNIKVVVDAVAIAKVDGTPQGVRAAAQRFLGQEQYIPGIVTDILAGTLRGVVGNLTVEEMLRDREALATAIKDAASQALSDAGLLVDTLQINGIATDPPEYITNLGRPQAAEARRKAEVAEADNARQSAEAQATARVAIAAANRTAAIQEAEFKKETDKATAEAAAVGPMTKAAQDAKIVETEQSVATQKVELTKRELDASVRAQADAALYQAQKQADAALYTAQQDAKAAAAIRTAGVAEADAIRAKGLAEGEAIRAKGEAEAAVKELLAEAYEKYGQQAVIDRVLAAMPEMLGAVAAPIGDIDNITVLGSADGASGIPKLGTDIFVQLPAIVKAATGLDMNQLFAKWFEQDGVIPPAK
ncbi:MAG: hypothetical protein LBQ92_05935 [Propionibacteriaceae bacterium]|jgi:flotillin|nr:hypothetical protein [Propionibacteriaceae bacterium]